MSSAKIRFAPEILRRLGEELNPSPAKGIIELAKNAYDADARTCRIELKNTDQAGGTVRIIDDGNGMDVESIEKGWLVLGSSIKSPKERTALGRIPAGSKGLGRLAALRMAARVLLTTMPKKEKTTQYDLLIDWSDYENVELVDDVELAIEKSRRDTGAGHGSEIILEKLHNRITKIDVKRLARELILLADPFGDDPKGFIPSLSAPEFADLEALVQNRYFSEADYHLVASVNNAGHAEATVVDWRGNDLFRVTHEELTVSRGKRPYECPPVKFDLWVFLLAGGAFSTRSVTLTEVRTWLQEFGGVHFYQNGLRVTPYGNPGNDWLNINLRRSQNPEERPSTNTVIGRVVVSDIEDILVQKTDRSGFIEGPAFLDMRSFAEDAMEWMASRRLEVAERRRAAERAAAPKRTSRSKSSLAHAIGSAPERAQPVLKSAFDAYDRSRDREIRQLRKEVQLYRTLSTAGITAATFAHESSGNPIKVITQSIRAIERRARKSLTKQYDKLLKRPVDGIVKAIDGLAVLGAATLKLIDHEKRRASSVHVHTVVRGVMDTFRPFLDGRDVTVELQLCDGSPYLRATEAAIESIITNLINNSLAAFERSDASARRIVVITETADNMLALRVLDNGPGIDGINKSDIWLPGRTTRKNGTGLGLTIVRDAVTDLAGKVDALEHSSMGGAEIIIRVPILGI